MRLGPCQFLWWPEQNRMGFHGHWPACHHRLGRQWRWRICGFGSSGSGAGSQEDDGHEANARESIPFRDSLWVPCTESSWNSCACSRRCRIAAGWAAEKVGGWQDAWASDWLRQTCFLPRPFTTSAERNFHPICQHSQSMSSGLTRHGAAPPVVPKAAAASARSTSDISPPPDPPAHLEGHNDAGASPELGDAFDLSQKDWLTACAPLDHFHQRTQLENMTESFRIWLKLIVPATSCMKELSPHAVYMRLKRLCEKKAGGALSVDPETHNMWVSGNRDVLSLALVAALRKCGSEDTAACRKAVRAGLDQNMCALGFLFPCRKIIFCIAPAGWVRCAGGQGSSVHDRKGRDSPWQVVYWREHAAGLEVQRDAWRERFCHDGSQNCWLLNSYRDCLNSNHWISFSSWYDLQELPLKGRMPQVVPNKAPEGTRLKLPMVNGILFFEFSYRTSLHD